MTPIAHDSFTIERTYRIPTERVFRAFAEEVKKRRWFAEGEGFVIDHYELDFRIGGFERTRFSRVGGPSMTYDGVYLDIQPNARIVYAYAMTMGGAPLSSSLGTIELFEAAAETQLRYTEYVGFADGENRCADRRIGCQEMLESLARELGEER